VQDDQQLPNSLGVNSVIDSPATQDAFVSNKVSELLGNEAFRRRTNEIIVEHTNSVPFMKKVQEYADQQIDTRIFKSVKVVLGLIVGWTASIVIAVVIAVAVGRP